MVPLSVCLGPRLILRESAPEPRLDSFAADFGWEKVEYPEDLQAGTLREVVWEGYDLGLHYLIDDVTECPYIYFSADMSHTAQALTQMATDHLHVYGRAELLSAFDTARGAAERRRTLLMAALGSSHTLDDALYQRIRDAAHAPEPELRRAAVYAASYSPSVRYKPLLALLSADDPDPAVRLDAGLMLDAINEVGTGGV
ncbi:hypothetical protein GCM10009678_01820 [Actinomadura kijaniata]|uniref:HEAT repeat domain-containing protein n=1 Tax=Actinomadura namibiensis TaxID=182080 RepID=A0A7W3QNQ7_ACTNM|nr:hypothetical protein [Actinomadura namibiensis]MBA8953293.1 hypothetical protein [Actinomadura namibiensis]